MFTSAAVSEIIDTSVDVSGANGGSSESFEADLQQRRVKMKIIRHTAITTVNAMAVASRSEVIVVLRVVDHVGVCIK